MNTFINLLEQLDFLVSIVTISHIWNGQNYCQQSPLELLVVMERFYLCILSDIVASSHTWLLSTGNVVSVTEKLN